MSVTCEQTDADCGELEKEPVAALSPTVSQPYITGRNRR